MECAGVGLWNFCPNGETVVNSQILFEWKSSYNVLGIRSEKIKWINGMDKEIKKEEK